MQTLTLEITNNNALKALHDLEEKKFIKIVSEETFLDSASLPGTPLSLKTFKNWIANAEHSVTIELKDAKLK